MTLTGIYRYPLKSGKATAIENAEITPTGIPYDRSVVVVDENDRVITGREYPRLTAIVADIVDGTLHLAADGQQPIAVALQNSTNKKINFKLFRYSVEGLLIGAEASDWVSNFIRAKCRLVWIETNYRPIDPKHGGKDGDLVGYADASPIHLISETSLADLNSRLANKVTPLHFRPNLIIKGAGAYEEDTWKKIGINGCEFEVHHQCKRCIFTTIDPISATKDENIEPLTTLAKFRRERNEELTFGIYLVPRKMGSLQLGDAITIAL